MDVRLVDRSWGEELARCYRAHPKAPRIICPFIKGNALWHVVGDALPPDLRVITRFDLQGFVGGVSDIWALMDVLEGGGEVRGIRGLHSKVFIFGNSSAAVTSANLTHHGLNTNAEFGCISSLPDFVEACQNYFDELWHRSAPSVTAEQLSNWDQKVAQVQLSGAGPGSEAALPDYGADVGQAGGFPAFGEMAQAAGIHRPRWLDEAPHGHVKFFGQGNDRAPWSLSILDEVAGSGSHWACTYPQNRRPRQVEDGDVMYLSRMVEHPNDYLVYGRAAATAYVDGRDDATPGDIAIRPWKAEWPHYIRVHNAEFIAGTLANGIRLSALIDDLGADSFGPTQENALRGSGNTNPRMSVRQHPAVRLSPEGLEWINGHFDAALEQHGRLPADVLAGLDWGGATN
jgi:hypothetical protein